MGKPIRPGTFVWADVDCENNCTPRKWHAVTLSESGSYVLSCRGCGARTEVSRDAVRRQNIETDEVR